MIRTMTIDDYDEVYALWKKIRGFGIRSIDDSREGVERFLKRNPTTSVVAVKMKGSSAVFCAGMTDGGAACIMCVWMKVPAPRDRARDGGSCDEGASGGEDQQGFADRIYEK